MSEEWIWYMEPAGQGMNGTLYCCISVKDAIQIIKEAHPDIKDDDLALDEFMVVNWAQFGPPPPTSDQLRSYP